METRTCKTCSTQQDIEQFRNHLVKGKWYREHECRACGRARYRARYKVESATILEKDRARYAANREKEIAKVREWQAANKERCLENARAWRAKNRDSDAAASRGWRARNPEASRLLAKSRRARVRGARTERVAKADIEALHKQQRGRCAACKEKLGRFHIDHIKPLSRGGEHARRNLQLLCPGCNLSKSSKDPADFMRLRGFLL